MQMSISFVNRSASSAKLALIPFRVLVKLQIFRNMHLGTAYLSSVVELVLEFLIWERLILVKLLWLHPRLIDVCLSTGLLVTKTGIACRLYSTLLPPWVAFSKGSWLSLSDDRGWVCHPLGPYNFRSFFSFYPSLRTLYFMTGKHVLVSSRK